MNVAAAPHPSPDCLRLFGTGQLSADEAAGVEAHVSDCPDCCAALSGVADDPFVALVRRATADQSVWLSGGTTLPFASGPLAENGTANTFPAAAGAASPGIVEVPAELTEHPRYRVLEMLGRGGMGTVYKAEHRLMKRPVALKLIARTLTTRPGVAERFVRETQTAGKLAHANIVQAFDAEQAGDTLFLVLEFVPGTDLARLVRGRGPLPCAEACDYVRQAALALQHAHERGMVHRDIKPHNLMLTPDGEIKVLDFGLARFVLEQPLAATSPSTGEGLSPSDTSQLTEDGLFMGTADYVAPEQARDAHQADIRADVYSLGCTLYHLLTARVPFPAGTLLEKVGKHATEQPPALSGLRPDLPPGLEAVVRRMTAKQPGQRYQTPVEVAEALAPFAITAGTSAVRLGLTGPVNEAGLAREPIGTHGQKVVLPPGAGRSGRQGQGHRLAAVAAGLLLVAAALAGVVVYRIQTDQGEIVIQTMDDDVEVVVKKGGKEFRIIDTKTNKSVTLYSGVYELELKGKPSGLKLVPEKVTLKRGDRPIAKVERVWKPEPTPPSVPTLTPLHRIRGTSGYDHVNVSRDGRYLAAVRSGQNISVWDTRSGKRIFERKKGWLARFSADSTQLITCETYSDLNVYDLATGRLVRAFDTREHMYYFSPPAGTRLVYQTPERKQVWDWSTGKKICDLPSKDEAWLTPDGLHVFQHSRGKPHFRVLDASTGKVADAYPRLRGLSHGAISSDGKRLLNWVGSKLTEYDVATGKEIQTADVGLDRRVAYSGNHRRLLTYGKARDELRLLDVRTGKRLAVLRFPEPVAPEWSTGHLSDDGQVVAVLGPTDSTYVFRLPELPAAKGDKDR